MNYLSRLRKLELSDLRTQFIIGFCFNLVFLIVLNFSSTSHYNAQAPVGKYENNIWRCSNAPSYIKPAFNFVEHGVFGQDNTPDYFRTIGYPSVISFFYYFFGENWILAMQIFQAIIFALLYPFITKTILYLFPEANSKYIKTVFVALLFSGTYFTRTPVILTDTTFTLLFVIGFYYGLRYYRESHWKNLSLFILFITIASLVRPTLGLFPIMNLLIAYWAYSRLSFPVSIRSYLSKSLILSIVFFFTVNISSFRNYANHSFFSPSSVIGINAFNYLTQKILEKEGQGELFAKYAREIDTEKEINAKTKLRKDKMFESILAYPVSTTIVLAENTINVLLADNLLSNIANFYNYSWKDYKHVCVSYKASKVLYYSTIFLMLIYCLLWMFFILQLLILIKNREFSLFFLVISLFIMFVVPAILTGDGGGRFRLPFEHVLFMFSIFYIFNKFMERTKVKP